MQNVVTYGGFALNPDNQLNERVIAMYHMRIPLGSEEQQGLSDD